MLDEGKEVSISFDYTDVIVLSTTTALMVFGSAIASLFHRCRCPSSIFVEIFLVSLGGCQSHGVVVVMVVAEKEDELRKLLPKS